MPDVNGNPMKTVMLKCEFPADFAFTRYAIVAISDDGQQYSTYQKPMNPIMALEFVKALIACVLPPVQQQLARDESRIVRPVAGLPPGLMH